MNDWKLIFTEKEKNNYLLVSEVPPKWELSKNMLTKHISRSYISKHFTLKAHDGCSILLREDSTNSLIVGRFPGALTERKSLGMHLILCHLGLVSSVLGQV